MAIQVGSTLEHSWATFLQNLPHDAPPQPLSSPAMNEAIARIYLRALPSVASVPVWGGFRNDTIYDAVMAHYMSQQAPGMFDLKFLEDPDGPIARLLRCVRHSVSQTRCALFACLAGVAPDGTTWPIETWHFFLHLLHCVQLLLAGTYNKDIKDDMCNTYPYMCKH